MRISEVSGQGLRQFVELGLAFLLSAAIGLEREIRRRRGWDRNGHLQAQEGSSFFGASLGRSFTFQIHGNW